MKKSTLLSAFLFFTFVLFAQATFGVTNYWDGSFNTYWHNDNNWSLGHIPLATEDVVITTEGYLPHVDIYNETCNSLLIDPGATLYIAGFTLTVTNNITISGALNMSNTLAKLYCKNILWQSGSTATMTGSALISLSGNWEFAAGANVQLTTGYTDFTGTVGSNIISKDIDCYFNHIRNYKSGTYLAHSSSSTTDVRINGNLYLYSGSILSSLTSLRIKLNGFLNNTAGTGTIQLNNGVFEFTGGSTTNYLNPGDYFYNLIINSTGTTTIADEVIIKGYLSIVQGVFNTNSNLITIAGNWSNYVGPAGFTEGTGRVIFNGSVQQYVNYNENFNILEVNKSAGALRVNSATATVYCATYDWTLGAVDILTGTFTAASLADAGIAGSWYLNNGGTINLYNTTGYVDLLGSLYIYGGTMNIYGGIDDSYWPYGAAGSSITMSGGILDFKETGIYVQTTGILTENITGGSIKTSGNLRLQRPDFTPTNNIFTMHGTENAYIRLDAGSINQLNVAKTSAKTSFSTNVIPDYFSSNTEDDLPFPLIDTEYFTNNPAIQTNSNFQIIKQPRDGSKASKVIGDVVTAYANISLNHIAVYSGTFNPNNHIIQLAGDMAIIGNLEMISFWDEINARDFYWYPGSTANVIMGNINVNRDWYFQNGTEAQLGGINIVTFIGSADLEIQCLDNNASFQNVIIDKASTSLNLTYDELRVSGIFTLEAGNTFYIIGANGNLIVDGIMDIVSTASMIVDAASGLTNNSAFTLNGNLSVAGDAFIHNGCVVNTSGELIVSGNFYCDVNPTEWVLMHGVLNLNNNGMLEVNGNFSIQNGTSNVSGIIRTSGGFVCSTLNAFKPAGGKVELFGTGTGFINCSNGNYFNDIEINKSTGLTAVLLANVIIKNDITINSGSLWAQNSGDSYNMEVGGQWTNNVGSTGFNEALGTVTFNGSAATSVIQTDETFYNLYCEKTGGAVLAIKFDQAVTVLNNLDIASGSLFAGSGSTLNVAGNQTIHYNAGLGFSSPGTILNIGGNWTNNNTSNTATTGFSPGNSSTVTFNGSSDQTLTTSAPFEGFYNLEINIIGGDFITNDNTEVMGDFLLQDGDWRGNTAGLMHTFYGDFTMAVFGNWDSWTNFNTVIFAGTADQNCTFNNVGAGHFNYVVVDKTAKSDYLKAESTNDETMLSGNYNKAKGGAVNLLGNMPLWGSQSGLTINAGTLNLNGNSVSTSGSIVINSEGILNASAGSTVEIGDSDNLHVNGGLLKAIGTNASKVHFFDEWSVGFYDIIVDNGGTISAEYAEFRDLRGNGLFIDTDGLIDPLFPLNNCSFLEGNQSNLISYLTINNNQSLTIDNANFEDGPITAKNVTKGVNQGDLLFTNAGGYFAGPMFENDAFNRIDWTGFIQGLWTGSYSTDWGDYRNWDNLVVPDNTIDVVIPAGVPNYPLVSYSNQNCKSLIINAGASLTINDSELEITNSVNNYGELIMDDALGTLNIGQNINWRPGSIANASLGNITIGGNWNFMNGTNAQLGSGNTTTFNGGGDQYITCDDADAELGTLVCNKSSGTLRVTTIFTDTVRVAGNITINAASTCRVQTGNLIVDGTLDIVSAAQMFVDDGASLTNNFEFTLHGDLSVIGGAFFNSNFTVGQTAELTISGTLICYPQAWASIYGTLNMNNNGLFEIHSSVQIPVGAITNIGGGTIRILGILDASIPNTFQPTGGTVEFFGPTDTHIQCYNNNYFNNLIINKDLNTLIFINHDIVIKNDFTLNSGIFRAFAGTTSYNLEVGGNWWNNVGEAGFLEEQGTVTFIGSEPSGIYTNETFYKLVIDKSDLLGTSNTWLNTSGITVSVLNNLDIVSGLLWVTTNSTLDVRQNLTIGLDAGLYGPLFDATIKIGGNWTNNNIENSSSKGFFPEMSNVIFDGTSDQTLTTNAPFEEFGGLEINKISGDFVVNDNTLVTDNFILQSGTWKGGVAGLTHTFYQSFIVEANGTWESDPNDNTIVFENNSDAFFSYNNLTSGYFKDVIVDKSPASKKALDKGKEKLNVGSLALTSSMPLITGNLTINSGSLLSYNHAISTSGNININSGGILQASGGSTIMIGDTKSLNINGGALNILGTSIWKANFTHSQDIGFYNINVFNGGSIAARHAVFEYLDGNGVFIDGDGLVNTNYAFTNSTFLSGQNNSLISYLTINNNQSLTIDSANFADSPAGASNVSKGVNEGEVLFTNAVGEFAGSDYENDPFNRIHWDEHILVLDLTINLEASFNGTDMNTDLNSILPLNQPYNVAPWNYPGTESVAAIPGNQIVDWVIVDGRDAPDASAANITSMFDRQAALLLSDGSIVGLDGVSPIQFTHTLTDKLFVVIMHRNHLGILSANPVNETGGFYTYDYTSGAGQVYGGAAGYKELAPGIWGMIAGDANADGVVSLDDINIWKTLAGKTGYNKADLNLDEDINNQDKNDFWLPNFGKSTMLPE